MITHSDRVASVRGFNNQLLSLCSRFIDEGIPESPIDRAEAVIELDNAISSLKQAFRHLSDVLQHHRNSLQPTCTLPFDVIAHIFQFFDIYSVIKASCVCRRWREVALKCPSLWTFVDMKNLKCRGEYADLFLSRSGSVPLTIILPYPIDESWDHITPEEFQPFFVRARTIRGFSLLFERTEPPAFSCPQLKSLYVEIRLDSQLDKALVDHNEIKHLSARLYDHRDQQVLLQQINPDHYGPRLRSMHLEDIRISAKTLMTYLLDFVALDQLSLRECYDPNHNLDNVITTLKPSRRRPFSFLSLKNCNNTFIGSFLHPQAPNGIVGTTDLVVSPEHPDLSYSPSIRRHDLVSTLRTNASKGIFMYIHEGGGKTWIETKHNALLYAPIPSYIPTDTIKSVICTGTRLLESRKFKRFSSLRELSFAFAKDGQGNSLGMVLNQTLVSGCPHLTYLCIRLLQTTSKLAKCRPGYTDDTELILPAFLEDWRSTYKQIFGHVVVEDEVNPERWGFMMDRIEHLVGTFEVRGNVIQEEDPELPSMELFELKEKPLPEGAITVDKFSRRASLW